MIPFSIMAPCLDSSVFIVASSNRFESPSSSSSPCVRFCSLTRKPFKRCYAIADLSFGRTSSRPLIMKTTTRDISASLFIGALILLILSTGLFSSPSLFTGNHQVHHESAAALVVPSPAFLPQRIAIPFGSRQTSLRLSKRYIPTDWSGFESSWMNALHEGARLLGLLGGRRTDNLLQRVTDLTGPKDLTPAEIQAGHGKGWQIYSGPNETPDEFDDIFDDLNIPNGPANQVRSVINNVRFWNCRHQDNNPTSASFLMALNVQGKTISALQSFSPAYMIKQFHTVNGQMPEGWEERLPDVYKQSDLLWILWKDVAGDEAGALKYIFRHHVITDETKAVMEHVAGAAEDLLDAPWPGYVFEFPTNFYTALLGTPHGRGIVYLLTQHADGLAGKDIESITVFTTQGIAVDDYEAYHLLFTLTG